jgi:16S rRNA (cytidine1402-2'-O)-methyltransferase
MALTLVATPIGNPQDMGLHALDILKAADLIILEEFKESTVVLRAHAISGKKYEQLNEHSTQEDLARLTELCRTQNVALITDCGTPGFCDPGADLVAACRREKIAVKSVPGASSLMTLLSLSSERLDQFLFRGFLPAENVAREAAWKEIKKEKRAMILMDTPYRFQKMLQELGLHFPLRRALILIDATQATEQVLEGTGKELAALELPKKAEFLMLLYTEK